MLQLLIFTWVFLVIRPFRGFIIFDTVTLTLEFDPFFENFNLANNFWTVSTRALIFHMSIPYDQTFPWVPLFLTCDFDLGVWPIFMETLTFFITFEQWVLEIYFSHE